MSRVELPERERGLARAGALLFTVRAPYPCSRVYASGQRVEIGPDQNEFFDFYEKKIIPTFA